MKITIKSKKVNVGDVKNGDYIKSHNIDTNTNIFNRVDEIIPSVIEKDVQAKVFLENADTLICSRNTRLYICKDGMWNYVYIYDLIDKISNTPHFMMNSEQEQNKILKIEIDEEFAPTNFIDFNVANDHNFYVKRPNNEKYHLIHNSGACTVALDIWHMDIEDFLELQTENGDQRVKAFDIFPQVVFSDEFMRRVVQNKTWTLFDPYEIKSKLGICAAEAWGVDFEKAYKKIERMINKLGKENNVDLKPLVHDDFEVAYKKMLNGCGDLDDKKHLKLVKRISARELFKTIMKTQVETGMPYIAFKDAINRANVNKHCGMIGSVNLCVESFSNFSPSKVISNTIKKEDGKNIIVRETDAGEVHSCNLNSINLANIETLEELKAVCNTAVRLLDNAIDFTDVPIKEGEIHNNIYRTIGVGSMALADFLAKRNISYTNSGEIVEELFENIAYYTINASISLAKERCKYPMYDGSDWSKGLILSRDREWYKNNTKDPGRWMKTFDRLKKYGIRNSALHMIAPNCQDPNNKIRTKNGVKSIYDILNEQGFSISEIENQEPHWIELKEIVAVDTLNGDDYCERIWFNGVQETMDITFDDGNVYTYTLNHKLLVKHIDGTTEWVRVDELQENDEIINQDEI